MINYFAIIDFKILIEDLLINRQKSKKKKMGARVHFTRNNSYNTRSNKVRQVRTPGIFPKNITKQILRRKTCSPIC